MNTQQLPRLEAGEYPGGVWYYEPHTYQPYRFVLGRVYDPAAARALLDRLGLPDTGAQPVREFSGGMKRRLALARALLAPFDALALDEPFTGLDRENRDLALACIRETAGDRPVLLVTHDAADAAGSPVVTL